MENENGSTGAVLDCRIIIIRSSDERPTGLVVKDRGTRQTNRVVDTQRPRHPVMLTHPTHSSFDTPSTACLRRAVAGTCKGRESTGKERFCLRKEGNVID
ncbi:hypothetical protein Ddc_09730 [Ditylenchus destructor]|nr:hypothetical protein Ddc_09730 [Ditylenchus destructor]